MEQKEIIDGNKLIAEFMSPSKGNEKIFIPKGWKVLIPNYHENWEHLMPVVEKLEHYNDGNLSVIIEGNGCLIDELDTDYRFVGRDSKKILGVFLAVVDYIKYINETLTNNK